MRLLIALPRVNGGAKQHKQLLQLLLRHVRIGLFRRLRKIRLCFQSTLHEIVKARQHLLLASTLFLVRVFAAWVATGSSPFGHAAVGEMITQPFTGKGTSSTRAVSSPKTGTRLQPPRATDQPEFIQHAPFNSVFTFYGAPV